MMSIVIRRTLGLSGCNGKISTSNSGTRVVFSIRLLDFSESGSSTPPSLLKREMVPIFHGDEIVCLRRSG